MYQALYRKYRPKSFDEIVGQNHITETLKAQIAKNEISHAYLFSGTRGTGKTSIAKIFARAVNCLNQTDGNPCNSCENCKLSLEERTMDIIEMDAASNNSVDDIREIRDNVIYPPTTLKYKVYIIDEVHMLSKGAFNALLKVLEEPPQHLIFILATTEAERIPATVSSRCQKFFFNRISPNEILKQLAKICEKENYKFEEKALELISLNSDGAMRDALSLLDQLFSFETDTLTYESAVQILGIVNNDLLFDLVDAIHQKDAAKLLNTLDIITSKGKDFEQLLKDILEHFRNLMLCACLDRDANQIIEFEYERYLEQSKNFKLEDILNFIDKLEIATQNIKYTNQARVLIEKTLVNLIIESQERENLIKRIEKLESLILNPNLRKEISIKEEKKSDLIAQEDNRFIKEETIKENKNNEAAEQFNNVDKKLTIDNKTQITIEDIKSDWMELLSRLRDMRLIPTAALLKDAVIHNFSDDILTLAYNEKYKFHKTAIESANNINGLKTALKDMYKRDIDIRVIIIDEINIDDAIDNVLNVFGKDNADNIEII